MNPKGLLRAFLVPVLEPSVLMVLALFAVLLTIAAVGGPIGFLVLVFSLPPIFRYLMQIVNPVAMWRLAISSYATFWVAPLYLALIAWFSIENVAMPVFLDKAVTLFLMFSFAAVLKRV